MQTGAFSQSSLFLMNAMIQESQFLELEVILRGIQSNLGAPHHSPSLAVMQLLPTCFQ